jgi:hypothetical protein
MTTYTFDFDEIAEATGFLPGVFPNLSWLRIRSTTWIHCGTR